MTALTICQNAALELGLRSPTTIANTADLTARQLLALANRAGRALADEFAWSGLATEVTHTTLAQEDQGAITTIAPGFVRFLPDTVYNRSSQWKVAGPRTATDWQEEKGLITTSIRDTMRIRGGRLLMTPAPAAGETIAFEYLDNRWCASSGGTKQTYFQADADTCRLDETLVELGIIWRYLERKGFAYAEAMRDYERELTKKKGADGGGGQTVDMSTPYQPRNRIPEGSWDL